MKLQVLVSTMHQTDNSIIGKMNIQSDAIIINQCNKSGLKKFDGSSFRLKWLDSLDRGLSKSRNLAISKADGDVCLLADDDLIYIDDYDKVIIEQFERFPDADIIAFQVEGIEEQFKKYRPLIRNVGFFTSMRIASVEIAFKLDSIKKNGMNFDEMFGSGAKYFMGEESIFLFDCLKSKLNIVYVPVKIADLHIGKSTWFKGYNQDYFISKGAAFTRMSYYLSIILIMQFAIRKYKLFYPNVGILNSIMYMLEGRRRYINYKGSKG